MLMRTDGRGRSEPIHSPEGHRPHAKQPGGLSPFQGQDVLRGQSWETFSQSIFKSKRCPPKSPCFRHQIGEPLGPGAEPGFVPAQACVLRDKALAHGPGPGPLVAKDLLVRPEGAVVHGGRATRSEGAGSWPEHPALELGAQELCLGVSSPRSGLPPRPTRCVEKPKQPALREGLSQGPDPAPRGRLIPALPPPDLEGVTCVRASRWGVGSSEDTTRLCCSLAQKFGAGARPRKQAAP